MRDLFRIELLLALLVFGVGGCRAIALVDEASTLRVRVSAEPKVGVPEKEVYGSKNAYEAADRADRAWQTLDYGNLPDIIVWLVPVAAPQTAPRSSFAVREIDLNPENPAAGRVVAVSAGQTIMFHNVATESAEVYSVSDNNDFSLRLQPNATGRYTIRSPGPIEVLSDRSANPAAELYAAPSRWVAAAQSGQVLVFKDVPPGQYWLKSWHPRLPGTEKLISVGPDKRQVFAITVGVNELPKISAP